MQQNVAYAVKGSRNLTITPQLDLKPRLPCALSASSRFDEGFDADQKKAGKEVKKSCNLNLAAAQLKLGNAVEARKAADKVRFSQCWYSQSVWDLQLWGW